MIKILKSDAFEIIFPLIIMVFGVAQGSWICGVGFVVWTFAMIYRYAW